jgi:hypothetical protein
MEAGENVSRVGLMEKGMILENALKEQTIHRRKKRQDKLRKQLLLRRASDYRT